MVEVELIRAWDDTWDTVELTPPSGLVKRDAVGVEVYLEHEDSRVG